ncbi:precursor of CEP12 [Durio zibethinus]|uniref:Precursor of CEP12 n=1 Tax=Durio zibethinus TaxID=66656 RepID=A0A6P5YE41_DURZI|nr:precursor of CEP12 [Durio zibethinus]
MAHTANIFRLSLFMFLLLQQHFDLISASRSLAFRASPTPKDYLSKPGPPSVNLDNRFTINRFKKIEGEAFRPTSPGHSPGVGHYSPPSAP